MYDTFTLIAMGVAGSIVSILLIAMWSISNNCTSQSTADGSRK